MRLAAENAYRRARDVRGESVTFRRVTGDAPNTTTLDATVMAIVNDALPGPLTGAFAGEGAISRTDRNLIVLASDLTAKGFPLPLVKNDKVIVAGELMNIEKVDPSKRGFAGAIEVMALGIR